jgi:hypothetical protein
LLGIAYEHRLRRDKIYAVDCGWGMSRMNATIITLAKQAAVKAVMRCSWTQ